MVAKRFKVGEEYFIETFDGDCIYVLHNFSSLRLDFVRKTDGYRRLVVIGSSTYKNLLKTNTPLWKVLNK